MSSADAKTVAAIAAGARLGTSRTKTTAQAAAALLALGAELPVGAAKATAGATKPSPAAHQQKRGGGEVSVGRSPPANKRKQNRPHPEDEQAAAASAMDAGRQAQDGPSKRTRGARPSTSALDQQQHPPQASGSRCSREDPAAAVAADQAEGEVESIGSGLSENAAEQAAGAGQQEAPSSIATQTKCLRPRVPAARRTDPAAEQERAAAAEQAAAAAATDAQAQSPDAGGSEAAPPEAADTGAASSLERLLLPALRTLCGYKPGVLALGAVLLTSAAHHELDNPVDCAFFGGGSSMASAVLRHVAQDPRVLLSHLASMPPQVHALGPALAVTLAFNSYWKPGISPDSLLNLAAHLATHIPLETLVVAGLVTQYAWMLASNATANTAPDLLLPAAMRRLGSASAAPTTRTSWCDADASDLLRSAHQCDQAGPAPTTHPLPATNHQLLESLLHTPAGFSTLASMLRDVPAARDRIRSSLSPDIGQQVHLLSGSSLQGCTPDAAYELLHAQAPDALPAALDLLAPADHVAPLPTLVCAIAASPGAAGSVLTRLTEGARALPTPWLLATSWVLHAAWCNLTQRLGVFYNGLSLRSAAARLVNAKGAVQD